MSSRVTSRAAALACLALVVSACAGGAAPASPTTSQADPSDLSPVTTVGEAPPETASPAPTDPAPTTDASSSERPPPDPDRPIAPDFSLELADGSTFVLSQETRPVFMVFWAEW